MKSNYTIPNKLLIGSEIDERKTLQERALVELFNKIWSRSLSSAITKAKKCDIEFVRDKLSFRVQNFINDKNEHREFTLKEILFIAQLELVNEEYNLNQLWYIRSTDNNPNCLFICFESVKDRDRLKLVAGKLGYQEADLCLELIMEFVEKHEIWFINEMSSNTIGENALELAQVRSPVRSVDSNQP